jgi:hypothetical protein
MKLAEPAGDGLVESRRGADSPPVGFTSRSVEPPLSSRGGGMFPSPDPKRSSCPPVAYRRPNHDGVFSSRWRIAHRAELADYGIPSDVTGDDQRWSYVLLHGDDLQTGWSASWLPEEHAAKLLALLEPHFPNPIGVWLVEALQRRRGGRDSTAAAPDPPERCL